MRRPVLDVSALPVLAYGVRAPLWWGVLGLIMIEGTALGIIVTTLFYLRQNFSAWPPTGIPVPRLTAGTVNVVLMLLSLLPMYVADRAARRERRLPLLVALGVCTLLNVATVILRGLEFAALGCRWDANAYASTVWTILGMHGTHLIIELVENVLLLALFAVGPIERKHFLDAHVNALYWYFIVSVWVPIYVIVFLWPRWS
jgi:heme/copper-type cytochrome/quinol oxidase subunit 3